MRIIGTVYQVPYRQHTARMMLREQSSRCGEGHILTMNITEDAYFPDERFPAAHDVAS